MPSPAPWYEIKAKTGTGRAEIYIFGVIVDYKWDEEDVTAKEFIDTLKGLGDIDLHINSPGGSVAAGNAIYNAMRRHKGSIHVYIDSLAASMGSVIAMGGDKVIMPANAMLMIHDPWSYAIGNASDMRKAADTLDKFKTGMVAAYQEKSGMDASKIEQLMSEETWITAAEALEMGFADEIEEPVQIAAQFDLSRYRNVPNALTRPPRSEANKPSVKGENHVMNLVELKQKHPDLVAQIETEARTGMIAQAAADTARTEAVSEESTRIMNLVQAAIGEEGAGKIRAAADKGLTAEDLQTLGVSLVPESSGSADLASREAMLGAITTAAPSGLRTGNATTGEAAEAEVVTNAILAGAAGRRQ